MPEINYNNPDFEWVLEDTYSWNSNSTDYFITELTYQAEGTGLKQTGTCTAKPCITTFAKQGFLLLLDVSGTYSGLTKYIGPSAIDINYDSTTGVFTIPYNSNSLVQRTNFTLNNIYILSYKKRFLSFSLDPLEIHNNDWASNHTLRPNLTLYKYSCNKTNLKIKNCFSLLKDEWVYYDVDSATSIISSINEYPIYKYLITDTVNDNHLIYTKTTSTTITWPQGSRERALLKSRGSHYLINNSNELQKRDFSAIVNDTNRHSETQRYDKIGSKVNNQPTEAYLIQDGFNQIMHNKTLFNQTVTKEEMSNYKYFNNDKYNSKYYTDLWDNNNSAVPTKEQPYIIYDNMTQLQDNNNITANNFASKVFWIDKHTLYCINSIYFIPSDWEVKVWHRIATGFNATSNYSVGPTGFYDYSFRSSPRRAYLYSTDNPLQTNISLYNFSSNNLKQDILDYNNNLVTSSGQWSNERKDTSRVVCGYTSVIEQANGNWTSELYLATYWHINIFNDVPWPSFITNPPDSIIVTPNKLSMTGLDGYYGKALARNNSISYPDTYLGYFAARTDNSTANQRAGFNMVTTLRPLNGIITPGLSWHPYGSESTQNSFDFGGYTWTYRFMASSQEYPADTVFTDINLRIKGNKDAYIIEVHKKTA